MGKEKPKIIKYAKAGEKLYCPDCKKEVVSEEYNGKSNPPILTCEECGQFIQQANQVEEAVKNIILPVEIPKEEYNKVINYLITIGFFKNLTFKK